MGFYDRVNLANKMDEELSVFLTNNGFHLEKTGYEKYISPETIGILRKIHTDLTVKFLRYMPDYFCYIDNKFFYIELKTMTSPILRDSRVNTLKQETGLNYLTKQNIGAVEKAAIENYGSLSKIGVNVLIIVYCNFHPKKLLISWEKNIHKFFSDSVRCGQGDASFTPFTNINLDEMDDFNTFFKNEFNIELSDQKIIDLINNIES